MREIKFRAWDKKFNEFAVTDLKVGECVPPSVIDDYIFMQYTGLKDKNGKEDIYEGDIVKSELIGDVSEIVWNEDRLCFDMRGRYENSHKIRQLDCDIVLDISVVVIGNIYENPELLN